MGRSSINAIRVAQLNCHRSKICTELVLQKAASNPYDVLLLQEPYVDDKTGEVPYFNVIQKKDPMTKRVRAAMMIMNRSLSFTLLSQYSGSDLVAVELSNSEKCIILISIYVAPEGADSTNDSE